MKQIILVTGGAGHVGSHIIEQLIKQDPSAKIISLDNYFSGEEKNHIAGAEYRRGHTKDIDTLIPETPDYVYHLGEYARVTPSINDIDKVYDMNIMGTFQVAQFCRNRKVKKLIYAASSTEFAVEGNGRHQNPYSFSKAVNVDLINNYGQWYDLNYAICYFYNAFGPREHQTGDYSTLIGRYEYAYLHNQPYIVVNPGTQKRNFTYVGDLAGGIIMVAAKGKGDGYVLFNKKAHSIIEIASTFGDNIVHIDGYPGRIESGEAGDKAREELGWETTVDIIDYIHEFKKNHTPSQKNI